MARKQRKIQEQKLECTPNWPPTLAEAMVDKSSTICIVGPVGSGKSSWAVFKIINIIHNNAKEFPNTRWCIVRQTYRELKDTTMNTYFYWFPHKDYEGDTYWSKTYGTDCRPSFGEYRKSDETFIYKNFEDGVAIRAEILFRSCETEDDVRKFKSLEIAGYHIDEAIEVPKEAHLMLFNRAGRSPMGWTRKLGLLTTNPPHERHWVYKDFYGESKVSHASGYKQVAGENSPNLPPNYYEDMREQYKHNPDWVSRYIEGNWGIILTGEKVYPEFHSEYHSTDEEIVPERGVPVIRGWDFGLTPCCVFTQLIDGQWRVFDELQEFNMGIDQFADKVVMYCKNKYPMFNFYDYADPAGWKMSETDERTCVQFMNGKGIYPERGEVTFVARREAVATRLKKLDEKGNYAFKISKRNCPILYDGFVGGYHFPTNKDGIVIKERPVKNEFSHTSDALQYAASRLFDFENQQWDDYKPYDMASSYA